MKHFRVIIISVFLFFALILLCARRKNSIALLEKKLNQRFYDYREIYPFLSSLKDNRKSIREETIQVAKEKWKMWPEKHLYHQEKEWSIFPFFGFDVWVDENCAKCPRICRILKQIPGLKTAILSKLSPGTILTPHHGWKDLSNYVLRCHYGIVSNNDCFIVVENEKQKIVENEIVVFDDSKEHYAINNGNNDRIVLLLDIERPNYVAKGKSTYSDTSHLYKFIEEVTRKQQ